MHARHTLHCRVADGEKLVHNATTLVTQQKYTTARKLKGVETLTLRRLLQADHMPALALQSQKRVQKRTHGFDSDMLLCSSGDRFIHAPTSANKEVADAKQRGCAHNPR